MTEKNIIKDAVLNILLKNEESSFEALARDTQFDEDLIWITCEELDKAGYAEVLEVSSRSGDDFIISSTRKGNVFIKDGGFQAVNDSIHKKDTKQKVVFQKVDGSNPLADLHPSVQNTAATLFENGHFRQAILDTYIALSVAVKHKSGLEIDNTALMRSAFSPKSPSISLSSDAGEQEGFMYLFAGAMLAIRNPKAHSLVEESDPQKALEWLSFASVLFRILDDAQRNCPDPLKVSQ